MAIDHSPVIVVRLVPSLNGRKSKVGMRLVGLKDEEVVKRDVTPVVLFFTKTIQIVGRNVVTRYKSDLTL